MIVSFFYCMTHSSVRMILEFVKEQGFATARVPTYILATFTRLNMCHEIVFQECLVTAFGFKEAFVAKYGVLKPQQHFVVLLFGRVRCRCKVYTVTAQGTFDVVFIVDLDTRQETRFAKRMKARQCSDTLVVRSGANRALCLQNN
jgi:hypothetical protein